MQKISENISEASLIWRKSDWSKFLKLFLAFPT